MKIQEVLQGKPGTFYRCNKCEPGQYYELQNRFLFLKSLEHTYTLRVYTTVDLFERDFYPIANPEEANETITRVPLTREMLADVWRQVYNLKIIGKHEYLEFCDDGRLAVFDKNKDMLYPIGCEDKITIPIKTPIK